MEPDPFDRLVRRHCEPGRPALVPELRTLEARELIPLWTELDRADGGAAEPPYWAFSWPGSLALARFVLDRPETVFGRVVLDVGAGNGVASVACARAGARRVVANDVDPRALSMVARHAARNGVAVETDGHDRLDDPVAGEGFDVVLVGDLFYARGLANRARAFVRRQAAAGRDVWIGEPGRNWALAEDVEVAARYKVRTTPELENRAEIEARVLRVALHCGR